MRLRKRKIKYNLGLGLLPLLVVFSCNSLDKDEYKILNTVVDMHIHPEMDTARLREMLKMDYPVFIKELNLAKEEMSTMPYTFALSDTIYPVILPASLKEDLHTKLFFSEIEDRSDKPLLADFNQLKFKKNLKRIPKAVNGANYIGQFKLHRVLFDKTKERAYVQIETPLNNYPSFVGIPFKKVKGEWVVGDQ
ncbi:Uncharacterised protein [Chryseobacterium nakagawai]|uniref:Lipoprotein n=1 Tax=Chryseobacterium nakagawai TaxID=1241982 RepID=A0AAD1DQ81_CHRNA|nr:hypothetical protein [Chryseobacterium nakagawai]AZA90456.1 hypothetical protein EG343_07410 [Chryseobacterium nakagawai]VEH21955.1 Uncharacterised protein [Chryseobacterium nakagawai]